MKLSHIGILFIAIITVLALSSCKKSKLNKKTTSAEDNALAEDLFDDIFKNINEAADDENLDGSKLAQPKDYTFGFKCATITLDPPAWDSTGTWNPTFPKTLTIDFGTTNCVGNDGKTRRGKITSVFTGKHNVTGTVITTTLNNYHVNDYKVEGTKKVTNTGTNSFSIVVNGKVTSPDGDKVSWNSTRTRTWIEGQNTKFTTLDQNGNWMGWAGILDDVYSITGTASGINRNGRTFEVNITTPLRVQFCGWIPEITEGVMEIQPDDLKKRTVDFGNQECDRTYTVEIGKKTYTKTY